MKGLSRGYLYDVPGNKERQFMVEIAARMKLTGQRLDANWSLTPEISVPFSAILRIRPQIGQEYSVPVL